MVLSATSNLAPRGNNAPINVKLPGGGEAGHRPGIGGGFQLRSVFLFKCPAPGKSSWVEGVPIPHSRVIVGQKNSTNDQKSLPRADL